MEDQEILISPGEFLPKKTAFLRERFVQQSLMTPSSPLLKEEHLDKVLDNTVIVHINRQKAPAKRQLKAFTSGQPLNRKARSQISSQSKH